MRQGRQRPVAVAVTLEIAFALVLMAAGGCRRRSWSATSSERRWVGGALLVSTASVGMFDAAVRPHLPPGVPEPVVTKLHNALATTGQSNL